MEGLVACPYACIAPFSVFLCQSLVSVVVPFCVCTDHARSTESYKLLVSARSNFEDADVYAYIYINSLYPFLLLCFQDVCARWVCVFAMQVQCVVRCNVLAWQTQSYRFRRGILQMRLFISLFPSFYLCLLHTLSPLPLLLLFFQSFSLLSCWKLCICS